MAITAQQVIDRIKQQLAATWKDSPADMFSTGNPNMAVTGIATSFTPTIKVLRQSVGEGKNLIITQQPAYYQSKPSPSGAPDTRTSIEDNFRNDPAYLYKKAFIDTNGLVIWRFYDNWNSRPVNGQLLGLAKALGWDQYHVLNLTHGEPYASPNKYFNLPEGSLRDKVIEIKSKLKIPGLRVIGDPSTKVKKASLSNGMFKLTELQEILKDPTVNLLVIAEAIEWESCEYFRDLLTWEGNNKAMILLGREPSEDPGYGEVASWLKTFITEIPIAWIPAKTPFWIPSS